MTTESTTALAAVSQHTVPCVAEIEALLAARQETPWRRRLKWLANTLAIGGGAAMAIFPEVSLSPLAFVPFLLAHLLWTIFAVQIKERELMYLNLGVLVLDIWAIIARLG